MSPKHASTQHRQFLATLYDTPLFHRTVAQNVSAALEEDLAQGDIHDVLYDAHKIETARVISREAAIMCGQAWVNATFAQISSKVIIDWLVQDGDKVMPNQTLFEIKGPASALLSGERTALNFMQCLMGTANQAAHLLTRLEGTGTQILDTRKTIPGLRLAQKYAIATAGAQNHRIGLWDAFLLKENHIAASGGITEAVTKARAHYPGKFLEVEVETIDELKEAMAAEVDRVLLDNFSLPMLRDSIQLRQKLQYAGDFEASGNVTANTIRDIALTGVDYISVGAITKHIQAVDLSFRLVTDY